MDMDLTRLVDSIQGTLGTMLPSVLGALAILLIGWIIAISVRAGVRRGLSAVRLNDRIAASTGNQMDITDGVAKVTYYTILLVAIIAFFNTLQLERVSATLQALVDQVLAFLPKLIAAAALLLIAWMLAAVLRMIVTRALNATRVDERIATEAGMKPVSTSLGNVMFWLVMLLFLPAILGALEMQGLLEPVQGMVDTVLGMLPNIFAGVAIAVVGWFLGRVLSDLVTNLLSASGADRLGQRVGLGGTMSLSRLVGLLVYIFVFVPALIAGLNALKIEAISTPATEMLGTLMSAIPDIFAAAVIIAVALYISRFVASLVSSLLQGMNFDELPSRIGVGGLFPGENAASRFVGKVIIFFVMLFAIIEAAGRLGFDQLSEISATLLRFGGDVLLGSVIIAVGFWIANLAHRAMMGFHGAQPLAGVTRFSIVGIVLAMGLRAMGLADDIVNLAFGLTLGAIAVAFALAFGLGGRAAAGTQMEHWLRQLRKEQ